jgi:hypothetical protein
VRYSLELQEALRDKTTTLVLDYSDVAPLLFSDSQVRTTVPTGTQPAGHPDGRTISFLRERLALGIAKLVKDQKLDEARKWADELVKADPEFKIGVQLRDVLADESLAPAERDKRIAALADEARKPIDAAIREAKLRRRLDERLHRLAHTPATQPAPADLTLTDNAVQVTILLADAKPETLETLSKAGLQRDALAASSRLVIGHAPRDRLADIALLDAVRRIEPTLLDR